MKISFTLEELQRLSALQLRRLLQYYDIPLSKKQYKKEELIELLKARFPMDENGVFYEDGFNLETLNPNKSVRIRRISEQNKRSV